MSVYSRSFIEPSFFEGGICPYADQVLFSIVEVLRDIICLCSISALLVTQIKAVDPYLCVTEYAVELQPDMLAIIFGRYSEDLSVPAHAGLGIFISYLFVTMAVAGFFGKRKIHHPIVRKIDSLPCRGVELHHIRSFVMDGRSLGEVVEIFGSASEVLGRIGCISECELPVRIEILSLAHILPLQGNCNQEA